METITLRLTKPREHAAYQWRSELDRRPTAAAQLKIDLCPPSNIVRDAHRGRSALRHTLAIIWPNDRADCYVYRDLNGACRLRSYHPRLQRNGRFLRFDSDVAEQIKTRNRKRDRRVAADMSMERDRQVHVTCDTRRYDFRRNVTAISSRRDAATTARGVSPRVSARGGHRRSSTISR